MSGVRGRRGNGHESEFCMLMGKRFAVIQCLGLCATQQLEKGGIWTLEGAV